jgi:hypothetical protein
MAFRRPDAIASFITAKSLSFWSAFPGPRPRPLGGTRSIEVEGMAARGMEGYAHMCGWTPSQSWRT